MATNAWRRLPLLAAVLVGGCAAVEPRASFPAVDSSVEQSVDATVHWNDGSAADRDVAARVDGLLAKPLDADAAVQVALLNDRHLQAVYEDLGVAQADLAAAGLLKNPVFDGSFRFVERGASPTIDLGIAFDFLDVLFVGANQRIAAARLDGVIADVTGQVLATAGGVKRAFLEAQAAEQAVELRRQVEQATAASADLARRLREAGNITPLALANERATHETAKVELAAAESAATLAHEELGRRMGLWGARAAWSVAGRLPEVPADDPPSGDLERRAVDRSFELRGRRAAIAATLQQLGVTEPLGFLSELEAGVSFERQDGRSELGPAVTLPIPIFGQGRPAVAKAQARLRQAEQVYYATAVDVRAAVRSAYVRVRSLRERADYTRRVILPLRQTIVAQTQLQFNAMQVGGFQLLAARRDEVDAAQSYLGLLRDYWVARAELELGLSGGPMVRDSDGELNTYPARPSSAVGD